MDWSQEIIPIGKEKVSLFPKTKSKYTFFPFDDSKSQILYHKPNFANYLIIPKIEEMWIKPKDTNTPWVLDFDRSCYSSSSGAGLSQFPLKETCQHILSS